MMNIYYKILFFSLIVLGFGVANSVSAASDTSCSNFNGILGVDTTCTLWADATDPEGDRVYYVFTWGDGSTTRVPNAVISCAGEIGANATVPSGTECQADHTYSTAGNPFTAFATAYDEANHQSVASASVSVFISSQTLAANLIGTPNTSGWHNDSPFIYTTNCTAGGSFNLTECVTQVSINMGSWVDINRPTFLPQSTYTYSGNYSWTIEGAGYRFRSMASDNNPASLRVYSAIVPESGQIQSDLREPAVIASSPTLNQINPFTVSASLIDYPNPLVGPNSGVSTWDLQYSTNGGSSWSDCRINIGSGQTSVNFGAGCSPAVTLAPNTTYCFQARGRDSTSPTQNEGNYYFNVATMCTPYLVNGAPFVPSNPNPISAATNLAPASTNLSWDGGDPEGGSDTVTYTVYIGTSNPPTAVNGTVNAFGNQTSIIYTPTAGTFTAGNQYYWLVVARDTSNNTTAGPVWTFSVNTAPLVSNVSINPVTVNASATISWQVRDVNTPVPQSLSFEIFHGPASSLYDTTIVNSLNSGCTYNSTGAVWNCTYNWDSSCSLETTTNQFITVRAFDSLEYGSGTSAVSFTIDHTDTKYYPDGGGTYDTASNNETKNFSIPSGSIGLNSSFINFFGSCSTVEADANATGNPAICGGTSGYSCNADNIPLNDLIPGQSNNLLFTMQGCLSTQYRVRYDLIDASCSQPYISVEEGSIYSQGNIKAHYAPPSGSYNATYLILGGGTITQSRIIQNFVTAPPPSGLNSVIPNFGQLIYPGITSTSRPQISSFDYYGLTHKLNASPVADGEINSYGHQVEVVTGSGGDVSFNDVISPSQPLGGKVYLVKGDLLVDQDTAFANGSSDTSGAGLIIVEGDLTIDSRLFYEPAVGLTARNLASVGWLVMGNVTISSGVSQVVGAFFVAGSDTGGTFSTGSSTQALTIYGAVIAKQLQLQRTASSGGEPSEKVIADGRVLLNTPPGFTDVMSTLPTWQFRSP